VEGARRLAGHRGLEHDTPSVLFRQALERLRVEHVVRPERVWDSMADLRMISTFARTWAKLHELSKPTIAAVQGWCIAGGTDLLLHADLIVAAESARFGYPPARAWGTPEAPWAWGTPEAPRSWIARLGLQRAKRHLFTGDEITGTEATATGLALECVPDDELGERAAALAGRIGRLPVDQVLDDLDGDGFQLVGAKTP